MISLTVYESGEALGRALADDAEEAMFALEAMAQEGNGALIDDIADVITGEIAETVSTFARRLADAIDTRD
ncbi:MAG: hypothetical protein AAF968_06395 [Pseudomonadota bacterium]